MHTKEKQVLMIGVNWTSLSPKGSQSRFLDVRLKTSLAVWPFAMVPGRSDKLSEWPMQQQTWKLSKSVLVWHLLWGLCQVILPPGCRALGKMAVFGLSDSSQRGERKFKMLVWRLVVRYLRKLQFRIWSILQVENGNFKDNWLEYVTPSVYYDF